MMIQRFLRSLLIIVTISILWPLAYADTNYLPMIKEGRVWEYSGSYFDYNVSGTYGNVRHFMKFDGATEINGVQYSNFVLFKSDFYRYDEEGNSLVFYRTDMRSGPQFYVREDNGKVFVLTKDNFIYYTEERVSSDWFSTNGSESEYEEFAIYDFTISEGDPVDTILGGYISNEGDLTVHWCENIQSGGESRKVMQYVSESDPEVAVLPDGYIVEGIGITRNGHLARYDSFMNTAIFNDNSYMPGQHSTLISVYEQDGTCIYGHVNNVKAIMNETEVRESQIYDVMGRKVIEPLPGTVYIINGRKFVVR